LTPPDIILDKEKISLFKVKFAADVHDSTSGVYTVKFYVDGAFVFERTTAPYEYMWTGLANQTITARVYDYAGNEAQTEQGTSKRKHMLLDFFEGCLQDCLPSFFTSNSM
jgi:hypothetical protein